MAYPSWERLGSSAQEHWTHWDAAMCTKIVQNWTRDSISTGPVLLCTGPKPFPSFFIRTSSIIVLKDTYWVSFVMGASVAGTGSAFFCKCWRFWQVLRINQRSCEPKPFLWIYLFIYFSIYRLLLKIYISSYNNKGWGIWNLILLIKISQCHWIIKLSA